MWHVLEVPLDYEYVRMGTNTSKTDEANKDSNGDNILSPNVREDCCFFVPLLLLLWWGQYLPHN